MAAASAPVYLVPMYSELCDSRASAAAGSFLGFQALFCIKILHLGNLLLEQISIDQYFPNIPAILPPTVPLCLSPQRKPVSAGFVVCP